MNAVVTSVSIRFELDIELWTITNRDEPRYTYMGAAGFKKV